MGQQHRFFADYSPGHAGSSVYSARHEVLAFLATVVFTVVVFFSTATPLHAENTAKRPPDVRLLIDISGSMKRNDPNNLRRPALDLLLQLLPENSKAGVWTFGQWVNMMIPLKPVDQQWRAAAKGKSAEINSVALFTNIGEALEKASYDFNYKNDDYQTSVILLTDGMVDISRDPDENAAERQRILTELVKKYQAANARIHTIALSQNADRELLERLAIDTNGSASVVASADELMKAFLRAFEDAVPSEQVPLQDNKFLIDSSIEEFTALVFKRSGSRETLLKGPDNSEFKGNNEKEGVRWYSTDDYDLITVSRPLEGEWQIVAELDPDNRVTVVSDLSLNVNRIPRNIFLGDYPDISASLSEAGKQINRKDFLQLLEVSIVVTRQETGKRWRKVMTAADALDTGGVYRARLSMLRETGDYEVAVLVDGKTFQRRQKQLLSVRDSLRINVEEDSQASVPTFVISVYGRDGGLADANSLAKIHTPGGRLIIKAMNKIDDRSWQLRFTELKQSGEYKVSAKIDHNDAQGQKQTTVSDTVSFSYLSSDTPAAETEAVSEPEPEPEPLKLEPVVEKPQTKPSTPAEPAPKAESNPVEQPAALEPEPQSGAGWLFYAGLVVGNILIIGLLYLAYKMFVDSGKSAVLEDSSEDNADIELDSAAATVIRPADETLAMDEESVEELVEPEPEMPDEIIEIAPDDDDLVDAQDSGDDAGDLLSDGLLDDDETEPDTEDEEKP